MSDAAAPALEIGAAATPSDIEAARGLFVEYATSLGFSLCFEGFDAELAALPGAYAPPRGALLLARSGGRVVGCVGLRPLEDGCEMKRLYLQPAYRGKGAGRRLAEAAITAARRAGHRRICLDTLDSMEAARTIYAGLGFRPVPAYCDGPRAGVVCYALDLVPTETMSHVPAA